MRRDDGVGIEASILGHIFEPFFTTKEAGKGTGLGLGTVHRIIEETGGTIDVESEPGEGTTFTITLPLATGVAQAVTSEQSQTEHRVGGAERILIVEDEEAVRQMTARLLTRKGYSVTTASSESISFDLLLTDVIMPGISGGELARQVRQLAPDTRVLYMSGYTEDDLVQHGISTAQASFIQKPFTLGSFVQKVRDILDIPRRVPSL